MQRDGLDNGSAARLPRLTEAQFLDAQIAQAKAEIAQCVAEIKATIKHEANPRRLAARHPWIVSAAAAGLGALAVRFIKTRGRKQHSNGTKHTQHTQHAQHTSPNMRVAHSLITSLAPLLVKKWLAWKTSAAAAQPAPPASANAAKADAPVAL